MNFQIEKKEKYTLIKVLIEKLDNNVSPSLKSELVVLTTEGVKNIVMDLTAVRYCDSSGLSAILVANRLCKNANGSFVLCSIQEAVKKLISISQLDSILKITNTVDEAVDYVVMEEVDRELGEDD
ncbi:MAG: STAS domain-containing protein [Bacteroidetes bacterium]|jgi:anti-sigma B factor antagonist|nr:STAS domain-containing protein [Bacteroidota bacterium]MBK9670979.1 STAS domain-containing protein [Bacteroidota bacterium]MBK9798317.1 STAS domain-containing protein [Bacteroidota bacterium]MBP6414308.1 STAS domain-containing protein [Bacteroidia bacterium]